MATTRRKAAPAPDPEPERTAPEGWRPDEGDTLKGTVTELDWGWSDFQNASYPLVTLKTDNGLVAVHCFHTVLKDRVMRIRPEIGDRLEITFDGKQPSKRNRGQEVAVYTVLAPDRKQDAKAFWEDAEHRARGEKRKADREAANRDDAEPEGSGEDEDIPF